MVTCCEPVEDGAEVVRYVLVERGMLRHLQHLFLHLRWHARGCHQKGLCMIRRPCRSSQSSTYYLLFIKLPKKERRLVSKGSAETFCATLATSTRPTVRPPYMYCCLRTSCNRLTTRPQGSTQPHTASYGVHAQCAVRLHAANRADLRNFCYR